MTELDIIHAYCKIRNIDNTIPDDVLEFMKNASIKQLRIGGVSQQRELLKAFVEKCNIYRTTMEEITPEEIDKFMDSL